MMTKKEEIKKETIILECYYILTMNLYVVTVHEIYAII